MFLAHYNPAPDNAFDWAVSAGGAGDDQARCLAAGPGGSIIVVGSFGANFPGESPTNLPTAQFGGKTLTSNGKSDIFVAAYTLAGVLETNANNEELIFSLRGSESDAASAIAVRGSTALIGGWFQKTMSLAPYMLYTLEGSTTSSDAFYIGISLPR